MSGSGTITRTNSLSVALQQWHLCARAGWSAAMRMLIELRWQVLRSLHLLGILQEQGFLRDREQ